MLNEQVDTFLDRVPYLQEAGKKLAHEIHQAVLDGGPNVRDIADLLHGTWLGHPLHPVLTDVVVGAWSLGALFDIASLLSRSKHVEKTADTLTSVGNAAAVPTAISGLTDFSTIPNPAADVGLAHALANDVALVLYLWSSRARRRGERKKGLLLSTAGLATVTVGAYLGGHLVYDKKVGVNHTQPVSKPKEWTDVLEEGDLAEQKPVRVEVEGSPVLLYRRAGQIFAIGATCPHAGGPLEKGQFKDYQVQCPWHDSVFDLRDGCVVHGPSTYTVPNYEARLRQGRVEVRLAEKRSKTGQSGSQHHQHNH